MHLKLKFINCALTDFVLKREYIFKKSTAVQVHKTELHLRPWFNGLRMKLMITRTFPTALFIWCLNTTPPVIF